MEMFISIFAALCAHTIIKDKIPVWYKKSRDYVKQWRKKFRNRNAVREAEELAEKIKAEMNL